MIYSYLTGVYTTSVHLMGGCHRRVSHGHGRIPVSSFVSDV
jgi:hypothetical protein